MKLTVNKGILMECVPEETGAPETEITLPEEVSEIREGVFRKAGKLRIVTGLSVERTTRRYHRTQLFSGKACVFPRMPRSEASTMEDKVSLTLGFCLHPELYKKKEGYRSFLRGHRELVEKAASSLGISREVGLYLQTLPPGKSLEEEWMDPVRLPEKSKNESEKARVLFAERAALTLSAKVLDRALSELGTPEFTARALGLAARYRKTDVLEVLLKHGFTFSYPDDPILNRKYQFRSEGIFASYDTMLITEGSGNQVRRRRCPES